LRFEKTAAFMGFSMAFMVFALLIGIFRLMSQNFLATGILVGLYGLHSIIMVFGFLAAIIMTERVAGVRMIPGSDSFKPPVIMVPMLLLGVIVEIIGYSWNVVILRYLGAFFLVASCLAFILTLRFLRRNTEAKLPFDFMTLSVFALLLAAVVSAFILPEDNMGFIMLLISFPMLFILGERIELTRVIAGTMSNVRFRRAFLIGAVSIILFAIGSWAGFSQLGNLTFLIGSLLLLILFLVVLAAENHNLKLLTKSPRPLQRYVSRHVQIAYAWAIIGMTLAVAYSLSGFGLELYDPLIHSLTVGFIGTMMLAHGPVILPGVLRRRFNEAKLAILPLATLTLAAALRVGGELLLLLSYSSTLRIIVGLSGWLVLVAVILFLNSIIRGIVVPGKLASQTSLPQLA
jgi:hypothetical protein